MPEASSPQPASSPVPSGRRSAEVALAVFGVVLLGLLAFRGYGNRLGARPTDLTPAPIDLNAAQRSELEQIPGVGPKLALAIDARRKDRPFTSVDELQDVKGVGPVTFDKMRPYLRVESPSPTAPADLDPPILERKRPPAAPVRSPVSRKLQPGDPPINVNTATAEELLQLPDVGPVTARAIIAARTERPFRSTADLDRVKGIGAKRLAKLRPFVVVE
jgi:competence protein ComEA